MDDFDKLLKEFIESSFSDTPNVEDDGPEWLKFRNYTSKGVTYRIPVAPRKIQYQFQRIQIHYNEECVGSFSSQGSHAMMEPVEADDYQMWVSLDGLLLKDDLWKEKGVVILLYREGHTEPLCLVNYFCDTLSRILWNSNSQTMLPGNYFALIVNAEPAEDLVGRFDVMGGCQRFFFQIQSGKRNVQECSETDKVQNDFNESIAELNAMVGLNALKKSMITTFNHTRFDERRKKWGLPVSVKGGHHMIFTGNPGTGKTTVAKMVGRIFHSMGLLSIGDVIEVERSTMIGRYIGETEQKMMELLERAKGNVLFIDEAYSLCDNNEGDRKDYGCRALECLLTMLSEKNPDVIVIMAGYEKEMNQMLELNPGMKGRFPYKFNFEDYNSDELFRIACNLLEREEYVLTSEAEMLLKDTIAETVAHKDAFFHNARWVEQYIHEGILPAMSDRVMAMPCRLETRELFQTIEAVDVQIAFQRIKPQKREVVIERKRIGFVA